MHGYGVLHNTNGIYEGTFTHGYMNGKGIMTFYNGDKYTGEFLDSSMTGHGCYRLADGTKITGLFDDGVVNEHAKKEYADGRIYIGQFKNDVENGKGVLSLKDGKQIKGIWKDAELVQEVVQRDVLYENTAALTHFSELGEKTEKRKSQHAIVQEKETEESADDPYDSKEMVGLTERAETLLAQYLRQFEEGSRPRHMPDGLTEAVFDVLNEVFDIEYINGDKYRGELAGDKRHGVGMYTYANGLSVIGYFKDNFLTTDEGEKHPNYEEGELVPMSFEKY